MTHKEFRKFVDSHPGLVEEFRKDRRIWISHIPSVQLRDLTERLEQLVGCPLTCLQLEPELEFVFFDEKAPGNSENELLELSHERAGDCLGA
ncbi:hypothetical protein [Asaia krungthepensis]|uniref:hypothetical protein n=1 Tax=Asaia krungthepensis TaxID=220990 RepID=UPI00222F975D|nr:hypothetical protein [Asaia krungthepensis]